MNEINKTQKITAIVCAFNEAKTIRGVMEALTSSPLIDEVIAVDDGSIDETAQILTEFQHLDQVKLFLLPENHGKGYAMSLAAASARGEVLCFVDADLVNFSERHIAMLVETFIAEKADMLLGSPVRGKSVSIFNRLDPFLNLTGQRVLFRRDYMALSDEISTSRYGAEAILNDHFLEQEKRVHILYLTQLTHLIKFEKVGLMAALSDYLLEGKEILAAIWKKQHTFWKSVILADHRNFD